MARTRSSRASSKKVAKANAKSILRSSARIQKNEEQRQNARLAWEEQKIELKNLRPARAKKRVRTTCPLCLVRVIVLVAVTLIHFLLSSDSQSSKKDPTGDSDASDDSDEEKVGMVKNAQGRNVNANISAAAITRGERGRQSKAITIHDARRNKHRQLPQVLKLVASASNSFLSIVVVYVIEVIMNTPSRRRPHHTTSMLQQVPAGTRDSKAITAFRPKSL